MASPDTSHFHRAGPYTKKFVEVRGARMAYIESGRGDPIVFLHGNPMQSYLWRRVIPYAEGLGRCVAPDLIGMGDSDRLPESDPDRYRFVEHRRRLDAFFEAVGIDTDVAFFGHDWGGALAFDWANHHRHAVKGLAYGETFVRAAVAAPALRVATLHARTPAGDEMVLAQNALLEHYLAGGVLTPLPPEDEAEYRRPWAEGGENRRAMLTLAREVPVDGHPADTHAIISSYVDWLRSSDVPKLLVIASHGQLRGEHLDFCRGWPNQQEIAVLARHLFPEDAADDVGAGFAAWYESLDSTS